MMMVNLHTMIAEIMRSSSSYILFLWIDV